MPLSKVPDITIENQFNIFDTVVFSDRILLLKISTISRIVSLIGFIVGY